jgi:plastocyanin
MKPSALAGFLSVLAAATILLSGTAAAQTTHIVTVGDNFFSPSSLTIQVGDTVEWRNATGGNQHNVIANNGSFSSVTASSFTFSQTFNSAGTVNYHCSIHGGMNGTITVEAAAGFQINNGLNDAWYNPDTDGQGFFVIVFPVIHKMFLSWFTYDIERPPGGTTALMGDPGHRWLTAFGDYSGDTAVLDIDLRQGGY